MWSIEFPHGTQPDPPPRKPTLGRTRRLFQMDLKLDSRDGVLLATVTGAVSFSEALERWKNVCDAAAERGCGKILFDLLGAYGELSALEKYEVSKTIVEYCKIRSMSPTVAVVGKPPTVTGFGALVASNRGMVIVMFSERQAALDWLNGFGSKTAAT
jgi:hypothetical protein